MFDKQCDSFQELFFADLTRYKGNPGLYLRIFHYLLRRSQTTTFKPLQLFYRILFRLHANQRGLEISTTLQIGRGAYLGHPYNITINPNAIIGRNCNIHKGCVVGQVNRGSKKGTPIIGNSVWIGINAVIVGKITIGDDVLIAPNSFVNCDIPPHSVVFGNPCVIKHREYSTEGYVNNTVD